MSAARTAALQPVTPAAAMTMPAPIRGSEGVPGAVRPAVREVSLTPDFSRHGCGVRVGVERLAEADCPVGKVWVPAIGMSGEARTRSAALRRHGLSPA